MSPAAREAPALNTFIMTPSPLLRSSFKTNEFCRTSDPPCLPKTVTDVWAPVVAVIATLTGPTVEQSTGWEKAPTATPVITPATAEVRSVGVVTTTGWAPRAVAATEKTAAPLKEARLLDGATMICGIAAVLPCNSPAVTTKPPV